MSAPLLEARGVRKSFPVKRSFFGKADELRAVDGVDLQVFPGETVGIVGESGCGKSTLGRLLLRLHVPTAGAVYFDGVDLASLPAAELRRRRREMQIIFQDPYSSLDPRMRVSDIVGEGIDIHGLARGPARRQMIVELLERVGLRPEAYARYPHEFSGGQRQRIGIARALAVKPRLIIADEPVSALDVSVQAQVINLLQDLQQERGLTFVFISHDLRVVEHISHRVAIMYLGKIVEIASRDDLYLHPRHPYTRSLLSAVPVADPRAVGERMILRGDVPSPLDPPAGCTFHPRCPWVEQRCRTDVPPLLSGKNEHAVACHVFPAED